MSSVIRGSDNFDSLIHQGLGVNQTWQDVTGSRVPGVTYTNSTGKPIFVSVMVSGTSGVSNLYIGAVIASSAYRGTYAYATVSAVIPDGATYRVDSGTLQQWSELR